MVVRVRNRKKEKFSSRKGKKGKANSLKKGIFGKNFKKAPAEVFRKLACTLALNLTEGGSPTIRVCKKRCGEKPLPIRSIVYKNFSLLITIGIMSDSDT